MDGQLAIGELRSVERAQHTKAEAVWPGLASICNLTFVDVSLHRGSG